MPIYEYECPLCGRFETIQKASDKPLKALPGCSNSKCPKKARRLVSASSFHLKGSGWYKTDYAAGKDAKSKSSETGAADSKNSNSESSAKSAEASANSKPAGGCGSGCGCHGGGAVGKGKAA